MTEVEMAKYPSTQKFDSKIHLLDQLREVEKDDGKLKGKEREEELKQVVAKLKEIKPETFDEAYNHPDMKHRMRWRLAIEKEKQDFLKRDVWKPIKRKDIPPDRRCIKCKWVFDVKRDGRYRARLVACGYSQIPGVDFTESYSPVINDITWRILLIILLLANYNAAIVDVETAFLHGILDEEIYMDCPPGFDFGEGACVLLQALQTHPLQ